MFNQPLRTLMKPQKFLMVSPNTTVFVAAQMMALQRVGAILIVNNKRLEGIFTERDALFRVVAQGLDATSTLLGTVMTPDPITLAPEKSYGYALRLMQERGFRHVPVVEDGCPVGIISALSAMDPDLEEFTSEARRREHYR